MKNWVVSQHLRLSEKDIERLSAYPQPIQIPVLLHAIQWYWGFSKIDKTITLVNSYESSLSLYEDLSDEKKRQFEKDATKLWSDLTNGLTSGSRKTGGDVLAFRPSTKSTAS